jgi:hypothetical protein
MTVEYNITCPQCHKEQHRREYRKRGGGVCVTCATCRKAEVAERARIRYRVKVARVEWEKATLDARIKHNARKLIKEYNQTTYVNRKKIKRLQTRERKTRATIRALGIRTSLQLQWQEGLNELLRRNNQGEQIPSLRVFMEGRQV